MEELDSLQTELENLLATAAKRMLLLQEEIEALNLWHHDKGKDKRSVGKTVRDNLLQKGFEKLKASFQWEAMCSQTDYVFYREHSH